jgi:hypothetical protein
MVAIQEKCRSKADFVYPPGEVHVDTLVTETSKKEHMSLNC